MPSALEVDCSLNPLHTAAPGILFFKGNGNSTTEYQYYTGERGVNFDSFQLLHRPCMLTANHKRPAFVPSEELFQTFAHWQLLVTKPHLLL
jgi:hypothetical protein